MPVLSLCSLTESDLTAAVTLDDRCFGGLWTIDGYKRELDSPNSEILTLRAPDPVQDDLLGLGCYWAILEEAHITILAVDPRYQRQGLGFTLLWALLDSAVRRGLERSTLEVRISNQSALKLYEKFGFKVAGTRRRYYQDTGEDALVLWRSGLQSEEFRHTLANWRQDAGDRLQRFGWHLKIDQAQPSPAEIFPNTPLTH